MAQGEIDEQRRVMFRDESTFAGFLNSNGFGANYRYGFWRNARNQFIVDADFAYVKHPKEVKTSGPYDYNTHRYVYRKGKSFLGTERNWPAGKRSYTENMTKTGFRRLFYAGGLSLGFSNPSIMRYIPSHPLEKPSNGEYLKFDPAIHQAQIGGRGPFFMGFNELKVIPD